MCVCTVAVLSFKDDNRAAYLSLSSFFLLFVCVMPKSNINHKNKQLLTMPNSWQNSGMWFRGYNQDLNNGHLNRWQPGVGSHWLTENCFKGKILLKSNFVPMAYILGCFIDILVPRGPLDSVMCMNFMKNQYTKQTSGKEITLLTLLVVASGIRTCIPQWLQSVERLHVALDHLATMVGRHLNKGQYLWYCLLNTGLVDY